MNSNKRLIFILLRLERNVLVVLLRCNVMYFKSRRTVVLFFFASVIISDWRKRITTRVHLQGQTKTMLNTRIDSSCIADLGRM